jgi:dipeptidyl-peptidase-4
MVTRRRLWFVFALALVALPAAAQSARKLSIEAIFAEPGLTGAAPSQFQWSTDGKLLTYILPRGGEDEARDLWAFDLASGEKRILVSDEQLSRLAPTTKQATQDERERERLRRYAVAAYLWSPDAKTMLFTSAGKLYLLDLASGRSRALAPGKAGVRDPKFSPDGRWVSFLLRHDIWLVPVDGGTEQPLTSGATDTLFHGDLDWVYPEEFAIRSGYAWSPDSLRVAFLELDQSRVPTYPITDLISLEASVDLQRYPRAGDPNPRVRLGVVEVKNAGRRNARKVWVKRSEEYLPRFSWVNDSRLAVQLLDRAQAELQLLFADARDGLASTVLVEKDPYWINVTNDLTFLDDSKQFLWTSERSGYRHIELYGYDGQRIRTLTSGDWEVKGIERVDASNGWVYYTSTEANPLGIDLYRIRVDGSQKSRLTDGRGVHAVNVNDQGTAYLDASSTLQTVPRWQVHVVGGQKAFPLHQARSLAEYNLVEPELQTIQTPDGALIRVMLVKPETLEPQRRYPLLVHVYGGPHAPTIRDAFDTRGRYLFHQYLVSQGYVVAYIDDRTSSLPGHRHEAAARRKYGPTAVGDYLTAVDHLKTLPFVDADRIGIWGWSGGGFSTCYALTHSKAFRLGIAVAPVTDWRLYDSIYTERYMGLPAGEEEAYRETSPLRSAKDLHGRLVLAHGTADDNVHVQNTVKMVQALIDAGKAYDLLLYPGKTHGIYGTAARVHLFRAMEEYLERYLKQAGE